MKKYKDKISLHPLKLEEALKMALNTSSINWKDSKETGEPEKVKES